MTMDYGLAIFFSFFLHFLKEVKLFVLQIKCLNQYPKFVWPGCHCLLINIATNWYTQPHTLSHAKSLSHTHTPFPFDILLI